MSDTLFTDEELQVGLFANNQEGPVTCLGKSFANDEERRAYFREELRKKLPELRHIEGFPHGNDDDIIALSDPPYYTACPNPWLNDFAEEWESEKQILTKRGIRNEELVVSEPYAADVSEGKNNPIYMAHAYHTKVPHPAIMRYILHYTQPGDIVFDGFAGTGMTGVAANLCSSPEAVSVLNLSKECIGIRHCICSDISPIASLINACYIEKFDKKKFLRDAESILKKVDEELGWMYNTMVDGKSAVVNYTVWSDVYTCPSCASEIVSWQEAVNLQKETIADSFHCPVCGTLCSKKNLTKAHETIYDKVLGETTSIAKKVPVLNNVTMPDGRRMDIAISSKDIDLFSKINDMSGGSYIGKIPDGDESSRNFALGLYYVHQLFSRRNQLYLSRVQSLVRGDIFLTAWFTSVMQNASKMYKFRMDRKGGIVSGTLFIPSYNVEQNPSRLLRGKMKDFAAADYVGRGSSVNSICSATQLKLQKENSVDYIFIDPPFGSNLMYSELNALWEGWLNVVTNTDKEAIVNNSQQKSLFEYQELMHSSLKEFYRILKPGKWLTMEFSNTSASVWNSIQTALQGVGFVVANVAALDKQQGSFKAVTTTTAVKQDLVITCYKPSLNLLNKFDIANNVNDNVWDFVDDYLCHLPVHLNKGNATTTIIERSPKILYDRVVTYYVLHGYPVPLDSQAFQQGLRERYIEMDGMFFTAAQAAEYEEKKRLAPDFVPMGIIVSDEANGIQWLKNLLHDHPQTYQDIQPEWMHAINGLRKNDILPELRVILEENFIQEEDGKWRLPNIQDDVDKELLRTKALLKEFKIYVEAAQKPKTKIKEARVEALRAGFKQCYIDKDFKTIVMVGEKIPQNLLTEDEVLLQFYDIAINKI